MSDTSFADKAWYNPDNKTSLRPRAPMQYFSRRVKNHYILHSQVIR